MISIIIHRWKEIDISIVLGVLSEQLMIPCKYNRHNYTIEIGEKVSHPIMIRGMYGSLSKMEGIRPDFYNCSSRDAEEYLSQRATTVDGVSLRHVIDVIKIIDTLKTGDANDRS